MVMTEGAKSSQVDLLPYASIKLIQEMGSGAFLVKATKNAYAFFFKGQQLEGVREEFLETIRTLHEMGSAVQEPVHKIDITPQFAPFQLDSRYGYYQMNWASMGKEAAKRGKSKG